MAGVAVKLRDGFQLPEVIAELKTSIGLGLGITMIVLDHELVDSTMAPS